MDREADAGTPPRETPGNSRALSYANVTGRRPGRLMATGARIFPGVRLVQGQIRPFAAAWHAANVRALNGTATRWTVLGDSMSVGIGASDPFHGWVGQARDALSAAGTDVDVVNLAAYGARVDDVIEQQIPAWHHLSPAAAGEVVSVLVGANDLMTRRWREALPAAFGALLRLLPPGALVALMPQPRGAARAVNRQVRAASGRLRVVDLQGGGPASWRGRLAADHFHPNDAGYQGIAAAFVPALRAAVRARDAG